MNEASKHQVRKQLKKASAAIDLIKISQRSQHTSIKEALRKILRSMSMIAEIEINEPSFEECKKEFNKDLMKKARKIKERMEKTEKEDINETDKTKS